jgi:hypothetical protein
VRTACAHNTPELLAALQRIERPASAATRTNDTTPPLQRVSLLPAFAFRGTVYTGVLQGLASCEVLWRAGS